MISLPPSQGVVAIIGGGPAGAATAIALARAGVKDILLIDAGAGPAPGKPAIGETIPPAATPSLRTLGLMRGTSLPGHLVSLGSQSLWGGMDAGFNDFLYAPGGRGYHLDRAAFDAALRARAAEEGVHLLPGLRFRSVRRLAGGLQLGFSGADGRPHSIDARFAVDATGAPAAVARKLGIARNLLDSLIGLCAILEDVPDDIADGHTLIEATEPGWWYAARLPRNRLILSLTSDRETVAALGLDTLPAWRSAFAATRLLALRIPPRLLDRITRLTSKAAPTAILSAVAGDSWLAVGDAAASYDPIGSAGITKALTGGLMAGKAIAARLTHGDENPMRQYQAQVFADFTAFAKLRYGLYGAENRWPDAPFWRRRLAECA